MRKTLAALIATLALLLGGAIVAQPAQATIGSTVYFAAARYGNTIRVYNMSGTMYSIRVGYAVNNVRKACPFSTEHIWWKGPGGTYWHKLGNGVCFYPSSQGTYNVVLNF